MTARPPLAERALAARVHAVPPSGIRRFFDIAATMDDVISRGVGEPEYDRRRRLLVDGLTRSASTRSRPRGAFYAFPRIFSTGLDDETFAERLLTEEHVAVVPESAFGPSGGGHVRMCYATSYEGLEEALRRIGRFVEGVRAEDSAAAG